MIDHLNITSTIVDIESDQGKHQIEHLQIPQYAHGERRQFGMIEINLSNLLETQEDVEFRESLLNGKSVPVAEEGEVIKNQFYSTERGVQTMMKKQCETQMQTDPLPM